MGLLFLGELANSIRSKTDIHFGLYHSLFEWYHPLYEKDKANNYTTQDFVRVYKQEKSNKAWKMWMNKYYSFEIKKKACTCILLFQNIFLHIYNV